MPADVILLLTHSEDFYTIDRVADELRNLGANPLRINTDHYPEQFPIDIHLSNTNSDIIWHFNDQKVNSNDIKGVWYRRIWSPKIDNDIDPAFRKMCIKEAGAIFKFMFPLLRNAVWMDPYEVVEAASNKLLQLQIAQKAGFTIPPTLVSNYATTAKEFFYEQNGQIITKMTMPTAYSMGHTSLAIRTHRVEEGDLEGLESLKHCPMMFQKEIEKELELRVIYVDGQFFTGALDASESINGQVDWRRSSVDEVKWEKFELPENIKEATTQLMSQLKLTFGALDIIKTTDNQYVFLEVNPVGEWGMLEKELEYPIAQHIAQSLYKRIN